MNTHCKSTPVNRIALSILFMCVCGVYCDVFETCSTDGNSNGNGKETLYSVDKDIDCSGLMVGGVNHCKIWRKNMKRLGHQYVVCRRAYTASGAQRLGCTPAWIKVDYQETKEEYRFKGKIHIMYHPIENNRLRVKLLFPDNIYTTVGQSILDAFATVSGMVLVFGIFISLVGLAVTIVMQVCTNCCECCRPSSASYHGNYDTYYNDSDDYNNCRDCCSHCVDCADCRDCCCFLLGFYANSVVSDSSAWEWNMNSNDDEPSSGGTYWCRD